MINPPPPPVPGPLSKESRIENSNQRYLRSPHIKCSYQKIDHRDRKIANSAMISGKFIMAPDVNYLGHVVTFICHCCLCRSHTE